MLTARNKTHRAPRAAGAVVLAFSFVGAVPVHAADVEGEVVLPPGGVAEPEPRFLGFMQRVKTPIAELRPYDPRASCFVYLEGTPPPGGPTGGITWTLGSASFSPPLLPVEQGQPVLVKNRGKVTHPLFSPDQADLFGGEATPVGPGGDRRASVTEVEKAIRVRSREAPHVEGRLIALPSRLFSRIARDGGFRIANVPAGSYALKVWCLDGWTPIKVPVEAGARDSKLKLTLPEHMPSAEAK